MIREIFSKRPQPYYILAPDYRRSSAGIRVMHMLCNALNRSGQEAYVTATALNPELMTPRLTNEIVALHRSQGLSPIAVYPEIVDGNPLQCSTVVRYLLNQPGFINGSGQYAEEDMLFAFARELLQPGMSEEDVLFLYPSDLRIFRPPESPGKRVSGKVCYYLGRRRGKIDPALLPADAVEITSRYPESWEALVDLFQQCEFFYSGEASALVGEAALCGCIGVVLPSEWAPRKIGHHETQYHGIAWGLMPDEIKRARETLPLLRECLLDHQMSFWSALDRFVEITQARAEANMEKAAAGAQLETLVGLLEGVFQCNELGRIKGEEKSLAALLQEQLPRHSQDFRLVKRVLALVLMLNELADRPESKV